MSKRKPDEDPVFGEVISSYTRKQAIEDGTLVDISAAAAAVGIIHSMAVTGRVYSRYLNPDPAPPNELETLQSRMKSFLTAFKSAARVEPGSHIVFKAKFMIIENGTETGERVLSEVQRPIALVEATFQAVCGPGDDGAPVITVMMMDED